MKFIDMHCDTLMTTFGHPDTDMMHLPKAMVDLARMKEGGQLAQFFAMFLLPAGAEKMLGLSEPVDDDDYINQLHHTLMHNIEQHSDIIAFAKNADDLEQNEKAGKMSAFLTIEDGRSVNGSMEKLEHYYNMGVRLISLTWNFPNCFGSPNSKDLAVMSQGLTDFGKEAVVRMNELGMLVDVSHLSDGGFMDVAKLCTKPFVASHSNCRALSPHQRNMTDEMIKILGEKGGVAGINFGPEFLNEDVECKDSTAALMVKHIKHFIDIGGTECVGLGSDFDGIAGNMEIGSCDKMPILFDLLHKEGISDDQIEKIAWKNTLRVIRESMK